jgi:hypothetical protein
MHEARPCAGNCGVGHHGGYCVAALHAGLWPQRCRFDPGYSPLVRGAVRRSFASDHSLGALERTNSGKRVQRAPDTVRSGERKLGDTASHAPDEVAPLVGRTSSNTFSEAMIGVTSGKKPAETRHGRAGFKSLQSLIAHPQICLVCSLVGTLGCQPRVGRFDSVTRRLQCHFGVAGARAGLKSQRTRFDSERWHSFRCQRRDVEETNARFHPRR